MTTAQQLAALCCVFLCAVPVMADPSPQELQAQIDLLNQQIKQLEATTQATLDSREVDATVSKVLADAERRSAPLADVGGFTAGWTDGKFLIQSDDGRFSLSPSFLLEIRYVANFREDANHSGSTDSEEGFEIRRMKMNFAGNAFTKNLTYLLRWETNFSTGNTFQQEAWANYRFNPEWAVQIGQYKDVVYHEETVYDGFLLANERSLTNALIGGAQTDRIQGVDLMYDHKNVHVEGVFHDGYNSINTSFLQHQGGTALMPGGNNFGISGRAEYYFAGRGTKQYARLSAYNNKDELLVLGGGFDWTQGGDNNIIFYGVDLQYEPEAIKQLMIYAGFLGAYRQIGDGGAGSIPQGTYNDLGFVVQAGYLLAPKWEIFGRCDVTFVDQDARPAGTASNIPEITVGGSYYWHGYGARFTVDFNWLPNGCPMDVPALNYLANQDNEFVIRAQLQFMI